MDDISKKVIEAMLSRSGKAMGQRLKPKAVAVEVEASPVEEAGEVSAEGEMSPEDKAMLMQLYSKYC